MRMSKLAPLQHFRRYSIAHHLNSYNYQPLKQPREIRLLKLLPADRRSRDGPLRCEIVHDSLDNNPEFEALSYAWGDYASTPESITVTNAPSSPSIPITPNCAKALLALRRAIVPRTLWVDAICINQSSRAAAALAERARQIALMGAIFRAASTVLIYPWGGHAPRRIATAPPAMRIVRRFAVHRNAISGHDPLAPSSSSAHQHRDAGFIHLHASYPWGERARLSVPPDRDVHDYVRPTRSPLAARALRKHDDEYFDLLRLPWFRRAWVVQEVVRVRRAAVVCAPAATWGGQASLLPGGGGKTVPWRDRVVAWEAFAREARDCLNDGVAAVEERGGGGGVFYPPVLDPELEGCWRSDVEEEEEEEEEEESRKGVKKVEGNDGGATLLELLFVTRELLASDPRDKIFSLLGIAADGRHFVPAVDYGRPAEEIYVRFARMFVARSRKLDVLSVCGAAEAPQAGGRDGGCSVEEEQKQRALRLPSWTPDWSRHSNRGVIGYPKRRGVKYCADAGIPAAEQQGSSPPDRVLRVKGTVFARIANALSRSSWSRLKNWEKCVQALEAVSALPTPYPATGESPTQVCFKTLTLCLAENELDDPGRFWRCVERCANEDRGIRSDGGGDGELSSGKNDEGDGAAYHLYMYALEQNLHRRTVVTTGNGYLGLAPEEAREGDLVCCLAGGMVPFVLREVGDGKHYLLVGECYVHGTMRGEAMEGLREGDLRSFEII